jgi:hypothetical protein
MTGYSVEAFRALCPQRNMLMTKPTVYFMFMAFLKLISSSTCYISTDVNFSWIEVVKNLMQIVPMPPFLVETCKAYGRILP